MSLVQYADRLQRAPSYLMTTRQVQLTECAKERQLGLIVLGIVD